MRIIGTLRIFADTGTLNLSEVPLVAVDLDRIYDARVLAFGYVDRSLAWPPGNGVQVSDCQIKVADPDGKIRRLWDEKTLRRRTAELKLFLDTDLDTSPVSSVDDLDPTFVGEVVDAQFTNLDGTILLRDTASAWLDRPIPPLGTRDNFPALPANVQSVFIPFRFGHLESIHDASSPPDAVSQGVCNCPYVDTTNFRYAVARHTVFDVIAVYRKRVQETYFSIVDPAEFDIVTEDLTVAGITWTITYIQFNVQQDDGVAIRADISGLDYRHDFGGSPPLLPGFVTTESRNVVDHILNLINLCQLETRESRFNTQSFATVWEEVVDRLMKCDADIDDSNNSGLTPRQVLAKLCLSQGIDFTTDRHGHITVLIDSLDDDDPSALSPPGPGWLQITEDDVIENSFQPATPGSSGFTGAALYNRVRARYALYDPSQWPYELLLDNLGDQAELAVDSPVNVQETILETNVDLPCTRDDATALAVLGAWLGYYTLRSWLVKFALQLPDWASKLDLGQRFSITHRGGIRFQSGILAPIPGWFVEPFKVVGLTYDLDKKQMAVVAVRYHPAAAMDLSATVGGVTNWTPSNGHVTPSTPAPKGVYPPLGDSTTLFLRNDGAWVAPPVAGSLTMDYLFDNGTSNANPGTGKFRFSNATENAAAALYINTTSHDAVSLGTVLDNLTNSTNSNKAFLRIVKWDDPTKFLLFYITSETTHSGYREFAITIIASSASSPFANGDECLLQVDQIGDRGATWYEGSGVPSNSLGLDGDLYLDTNSVIGAGAFVKIDDQLLGSDAASVTIPASGTIPQTYRHLLLVVYGRNTNAVADDYVYIQFNGDTGANYDYQHAIVANSTPGNTAVMLDTRIRIGDLAGASSSRSTQPGMAKAFIPHYAGSTFEKIVKAEGFATYSTSSGVDVMQNGGGWRNTAAITSITVLPATNNFKAGSLFTLYGIV